MPSDISTKVSLTVVAAFLILLPSLLLIVAKNSLDFAKTQAVAQQETSMRVAWDAIGGRHATFSRQGDQLLANGEPLNGDIASVDHIKELVGGVATVFMGDTRIATNVLEVDGGRAIGTKLAASPVHDAAGLSEVNIAVNQMDQTTQHNSDGQQFLELQPVPAARGGHAQAPGGAVPGERNAFGSPDGRLGAGAGLKPAFTPGPGPFFAFDQIGVAVHLSGHDFQHASRRAIGHLRGLAARLFGDGAKFEDVGHAPP
ncbi:cache domain-containing protein [Caulobacter sp. 73W]|uniref:Cache domain-containing protein n=1 Tax=Caulobacter sp. 73W TaxID=3161137 RepID=A0AB39KWF4_9CAUL